MFERFSDGARTAVIQAQQHARRLGHRYIGCEHLLLAVAAGGEPASAALRERGVTPEKVETEIVRLTSHPEAAGLFSAADREALAFIGIDLDVVRARIEAAFGPDAFTRGVPGICQRGRAARRKGPVTRLLRRRRCHPHGGAARHGGAGTAAAGHIPFTARAKKSLQDSLREAQVRRDGYIGVEHIALALVTMNGGAVPLILSALGTSPAALRAAILDRYRRAG